MLEKREQENSTSNYPFNFQDQTRIRSRSKKETRELKSWSILKTCLQGDLLELQGEVTC